MNEEVTVEAEGRTHTRAARSGTHTAAAGQLGAAQEVKSVSWLFPGCSCARVCVRFLSHRESAAKTASVYLSHRSTRCQKQATTSSNSRFVATEDDFFTTFRSWIWLFIWKNSQFGLRFQKQDINSEFSCFSLSLFLLTVDTKWQNSCSHLKPNSKFSFSTFNCWN